MVLLSQFPIDASVSRTFQHFLYKDMPTALLPKDPETGLPWYSQDDLKVGAFVQPDLLDFVSAASQCGYSQFTTS
jgi:hypothetical protein